MLDCVNSAPGSTKPAGVINGAATSSSSCTAPAASRLRRGHRLQGFARRRSVEIIVTLLFSGSEVRPPSRRDDFAT